MAYYNSQLWLRRSVYTLGIATALTLSPEVLAKSKKKRDNSSSNYRAQKTGQVDLSLSLLDTGSVITPRLSYGHYLSSNLMLEAGISHFSFHSPEDGDDSDLVENTSDSDSYENSSDSDSSNEGLVPEPVEFQNKQLKETALHLGLKKFVANSFYGAAGIYSRQSEKSWELITTEETGTYKVQSFGISAGVGNHWIHNKFTVGVDWLKYAHPLTSTEELSTGDSWSESQKDELSQSFIPGITLTRVYLGFAF